MSCKITKRPEGLGDGRMLEAQGSIGPEAQLAKQMHFWLPTPHPRQMADVRSEQKDVCLTILGWGWAWGCGKR